MAFLFPDFVSCFMVWAWQFQFHVSCSLNFPLFHFEHRECFYIYIRFYYPLIFCRVAEHLFLARMSCDLRSLGSPVAPLSL